jgi:hypothetical protein
MKYFAKKKTNETASIDSSKQENEIINDIFYRLLDFFGSYLLKLAK